MTIKQIEKLLDEAMKINLSKKRNSLVYAIAEAESQSMKDVSINELFLLDEFIEMIGDDLK